MMKTILVPVDQSAGAEKALAYAKSLARQLNAKIVMTHAFDVPFATAEVPFDVIEEDIHRKKSESMTMMKTMFSKMKNTSDLPVEYVALEGDPATVILDTATSRKADFLIIGTKGSGNTSSPFGRTVTQVIEKAQCPVIAVPLRSETKVPMNIVYATDYRRSELPSIASLSNLSKSCNANLRVVHVSEDELMPVQEKEIMHAFQLQVQDALPKLEIKYNVLHGDSVAKRLQKHAVDTSADLLALTAKRHGFFQRLFVDGIAKQLVEKQETPMMVLHMEGNGKEETGF